MIDSFLIPGIYQLLSSLVTFWPLPIALTVSLTPLPSLQEPPACPPGIPVTTVSLYNYSRSVFLKRSFQCHY